MSSIPLGGPVATVNKRFDSNVTGLATLPQSETPHTTGPAVATLARVGTCSGPRHKPCKGRPCLQGYQKPTGKPSGSGAPSCTGTHRRRVSRLRETSRYNVSSAIPPGSVPISHTLQVWRALSELPGYALARKDRKLTLTRVLWVLMRCADFETMTTRPTLAVLMARTGRTRTPVLTALRTLRAWGLLGIVAGGRQAAHATKGLDGERINEAAVYVLCRPAGRGLRDLPVLPEHAAAVAQREAASQGGVERKSSPPAKQVPSRSLESHLHARTRKTTEMEPLRGPDPSRRGASAAQPRHPAHRPELTWEPHQTMASKQQWVAGISAMRNRSPVLREFSIRDLRSLMRHHLEAGYTVHDLVHALEALPAPDPITGQERWDALPMRSPHEHPTEWKIRVREMIRHRLERWTTPTGEVMRSYDQRQAALQTQLHAQARAAHERREAAAAAREHQAAIGLAGAARVRQAKAACPPPAWAE